MIKTILCDRCGEEIGESEAARALFSSALPANISHAVASDSFAEENAFIDLCPRCVMAFHKWMAEGQPDIDLSGDIAGELSIPEEGTVS